MATASAPLPSLQDLHARCAEEAIHVPGATQPFGAVLAGELGDFTVRHASANLGDFLPVTGTAALGLPLAGLLPDLPPDAFDFSRGELSRTLPLTRSHPPLHATCHIHASRWLVQIERAIPGETALAIDAQSLLRLSRHESLPSLLGDAAGLFRALLGYQRVMIYRFHEDWHGEVVAESIQGRHTRYNGLHFPATDIPAQARALYHYERIRLIPDATADSVPLLSASTDARLDLTGCTARAISPVHCEYLGNMGVRATLVISILVEGRLWGLVACHHPSPRHTAPLLRASALALAEMLALQIDHHGSRAHSVRQATFRQHVIQLGLRLDGRQTPWDIFRDSADELLAPLHAEGIALLGPGQQLAQGLAPDNDALQLLRAWLDARHLPGEILALPTLPPEFVDCTGWPAELAGLLAAPAAPGIWLVLFRIEWPREIRWGGDPRETVHLRPDGTLAPRASFAAWSEIQRGRARPWTAAEIDYVQQLALTLRNGQLIQERHRAETDYRRSEASRAAILAALPDLLFVLDDQDTYLDVHVPPGVTPFLPAAALLGRTVAQVLPAHVAERHLLARQALENGEPVSVFNYALELPGQGLRHFESRLVRSGPGQILCIARDITRREQTRLLVERLALVARHTASAVIFTDPERRIVWVNEAFTRISGYSEAEAIGRSPAFLQGPDTDPATIIAIRTALEQGERFSGEILNYARDGRSYWLELEIIPHLDPEGRLLGFIGVQADITARKKTELALRERDERFAAISRHVPGVIYQYRTYPDGTYQFTYLSDGAEELWGVPRGELFTRGFPLLGRVHLDDQEHMLEQGRLAAESLSSFRNTLRYRHPARGLRWLATHDTPTPTPDGTLLWHGYASDVTDLVEAQQAVRDNEDNFRVVLEGIPAAIFLKDGEGRWLFANQLGLARAGLLDTPWHRRTNEDFAALFPEKSAFFQACSAKEETTWAARGPVTFEEQSTAADGSPAYAEITKVPLFQPDGSRRALVMIVNDVTVRRTAADLVDRERRLFTAGPVAVIVWRPVPGMPVEYVSANIEAILGYPPASFTARDFNYARLIHSDDFDRVRAEAREKHRRRVPSFEQSYRLQAADGSYRWIYDYSHLEYTADGEIASIRGYLFDQTQLVAAQDALRERNEQIASISAHVPGMLYEFRLIPGGGSCIPYASAGIHDLFGITPESVVEDGSALFALIHPEDRDRLNCSITDASASIGDWTADFRILHPTRGTRWVHGSSSPRKLEDGTYVWDGYLFDITERKNAEENLLRDGKREAIERLAGGVAHDFNNYLASLALSADLLLSFPNLDPRVREIASTLNAEIDAATAVARQLLAFTKDQPVHRELIGLDGFLRDCAAFALRGSPMRALVDVPDRALQVSSDPDLLRQIVFNLILNSRQAMRDKGSVLISAESSADQICIRVGDTGPGIPEHHRAKIFEPYFTTKSSGSGLGLFVVRSVLRRLGGDIRLDATGGEGAVFLITLPADFASPPSVSASLVEKPPEPHFALRPQTGGHHILLLEDEPGQTRLLSSFFSTLQVPLRAYADGAVLLAEAYAHRARGAEVVCLLDITVRGGLGGLDIAPALREALPAARIFLVSGYAAEWQEKQSSLANLNIGFIAKPYHLRDLHARLFNPS